MDSKGFIENFAHQVQCYRDLLQLARRKKDILVAGKVQELDKLLGVEQALLLRARQLEEERLSLLEGVGAELNMEPGELTREHLFSRQSAGEREEFARLEEDLREILAQLQEENQLNQQLIQQALDFIEFSRGLLSGIDGHILDKKA
ncbi:MAG: flagellar export chaperone FlgN [Bacillota bacterium]|nr:flagellar export chaperone FlgN [Bacillota bacterium]